MTRVVVHADDVGMCRGANRAFVQLSHFGTITAGSVMVPCSGFQEMATIAADDSRLDLGVHLTLNAEFESYRWGPVASHPPSAGLVDDDGFLWPDVSSLRQNAHPEAVDTEWRAQIDKALSSGVEVTHLDAHMGSALAPEWCDRYIALGVDYALPVLMPCSLAAYGPNNHLADVEDTEFAGFVAEAKGAGMVLFDEVLETDFLRGPTQRVDYEALLEDVAGDLVYCAFHPAAPGEVEAIDSGRAHVRTDEYELFRTEEWRSWLRARPFESVGMADL